jgi:hypothetical protein
MGRAAKDSHGVLCDADSAEVLRNAQAEAGKNLGVGVAEEALMLRVKGKTELFPAYKLVRCPVGSLSRQTPLTSSFLRRAFQKRGKGFLSLQSSFDSGASSDNVPNTIFVGRAKEQSAIFHEIRQYRLEPKPTTLAVHGAYGAGKSALARHVLSQIRHGIAPLTQRHRSNSAPSLAATLTRPFRDALFANTEEGEGGGGAGGGGEGKKEEEPGLLKSNSNPSKQSVADVTGPTVHPVRVEAGSGESILGLRVTSAVRHMSRPVRLRTNVVAGAPVERNTPWYAWRSLIESIVSSLDFHRLPEVSRNCLSLLVDVVPWFHPPRFRKGRTHGVGGRDGGGKRGGEETVEEGEEGRGEIEIGVRHCEADSAENALVDALDALDGEARTSLTLDLIVDIMVHDPSIKSGRIILIDGVRWLDPLSLKLLARVQREVPVFIILISPSQNQNLQRKRTSTTSSRSGSMLQLASHTPRGYGGGGIGGGGGGGVRETGGGLASRVLGVDRPRMDFNRETNGVDSSVIHVELGLLDHREKVELANKILVEGSVMSRSKYLPCSIDALDDDFLPEDAGSPFGGSSVGGGSPFGARQQPSGGGASRASRASEACGTEESGDSGDSGAAGMSLERHGSAGSVVSTTSSILRVSSRGGGSGTSPLGDDAEIDDDDHDDHAEKERKAAVAVKAGSPGGGSKDGAMDEAKEDEAAGSPRARRGTLRVGFSQKSLGHDHAAAHLTYHRNVVRPLLEVIRNLSGRPLLLEQWCVVAKRRGIVEATPDGFKVLTDRLVELSESREMETIAQALVDACSSTAKSLLLVGSVACDGTTGEVYLVRELCVQLNAMSGPNFDSAFSELCEDVCVWSIPEAQHGSEDGCWGGGGAGGGSDAGYAGGAGGGGGGGHPRPIMWRKTMVAAKGNHTPF